MDVTKENFNQLYPEIVESLKAAKFIAIDTEFTSLLVDENLRNTYFDGPASRYSKQRENLKDVSICQIGLSAFKGVPDSNVYQATTYNFLVRPYSLISEAVITCQISSLEFLHENKFSFDKWISDGIPFLNKEQEQECMKKFSDMLSGNLSLPFSAKVSDQLRAVNSWKAEGASEALKIPLRDPSSILLFIATIHTSFDDIYASTKDGDTIVCTCDAKQRAETSLTAANEAFDRFLDHTKGFAKVFDVLLETKTPLIVHNGLLDLLLIYKQFLRSLPPHYRTFKDDLHGYFPLIYDTKFLTNSITRSFKHEEKGELKFLEFSSLQNVKKQLQERMVALYRPKISHNNVTPKYSAGVEFPHEAGYDAFCTGYCFIHLSHIYEMKKYPNLNFQRPLSIHELLHAMSLWANQIPLTRASVPYMDLSNRDPRLRTGSWLVLEHKLWRPISATYVSSLLSSYGGIDVVSRNKWSVLVAASRISLAREVHRNLSAEKQFRVMKFSPIRHSPLMRTFAWSCMAFSTGLVTWALARTWKNLNRLSA